jgi:hypothetical protein
VETLIHFQAAELKGRQPIPDQTPLSLEQDEAQGFVRLLNYLNKGTKNRQF